LFSFFIQEQVWCFGALLLLFGKPSVPTVAVINQNCLQTIFPGKKHDGKQHPNAQKPAMRQRTLNLFILENSINLSLSTWILSHGCSSTPILRRVVPDAQSAVYCWEFFKLEFHQAILKILVFI
jgi:hypothetical protein